MNKKFKLLVLGDSISQGFNSKTGSYTYGYKKSDDKFYKGLSYGDFLIELFYHNIYSNKKLSNEEKNNIWSNIEYNNLSLAIVRIHDYIDLLNKNYENTELFKTINLNKKINECSTFKSNFTNDFWTIDNNLKFKANFDNLSNELISELKTSDLLLISLGGNDYQSSLPYQYINYLIHEKNYFSIEKIKKIIFDNIKDILKKIELKYIDFIQKIKSINSKLNIILVGYSPSFFPLLLKIEELTKKKNPTLFADFFKLINKLLNDSLEYISKATNTYYVQTFFFTKWKKYANIFYENAIDVHPTELGYQQIAKNIYDFILKNKITNFLNKKNIFKNLSINKLINISNKYKSDFNLLFDIKNIKNNNILNILNAIFSLQKSIGNPYFKILVKNFNANSAMIPTNIISRNEYLTLSNVLSENLFYIINKLDNSNIKDFLTKIKNEDDELIKIIGFILSSKELNNLINNFEKEFSNYKYVNIKHFFTLYMSKNQQLIFSLFKKLYFDEQLKFKNLIINFINAIKNDINKHNIYPVINDDIKNFFLELSNDEITLNIFNEIINLLIDDFDKFNNYDNFDLFINEFILLKKDLIKNYIRSFFNFSNTYFSNYKNKLASFILSFLKVNINDLSNRDWKKLNKVIKIIFSTLNNDTKKEDLVDLIFEMLIKTKFWDFVKLDANNFVHYMFFIWKKFKYVIKKIIFRWKYRYILNIIIRLFFLRTSIKIKNIFKYK